MSSRKLPNSEYYNKPHWLVSLIDALNLALATIILLSPIIGYFVGGKWGAAAGGLIIFMTVHYWAGIFREHGRKVLPKWIKTIFIRLTKKN